VFVVSGFPLAQDCIQTLATDAHGRQPFPQTWLLERDHTPLVTRLRNLLRRLVGQCRKRPKILLTRIGTIPPSGARAVIAESLLLTSVAGSEPFSKEGSEAACLGPSPVWIGCDRCHLSAILKVAVAMHPASRAAGLPYEVPSAGAGQHDGVGFDGYTAVSSRPRALIRSHATAGYGTGVSRNAACVPVSLTMPLTTICPLSLIASTKSAKRGSHSSRNLLRDIVLGNRMPFAPYQSWVDCIMSIRCRYMSSGHRSLQYPPHANWHSS
jgi:hypothetical protein